MNKIVNFFKTDENYKQTILEYGKKDGIFALIMYALVMVLYYCMGAVYASKNLYLGYQVNIGLVLLCIGLVVARKQPLKSIGISKKNLKTSLILGAIPSILLLTVMLIAGLLGGDHFETASNLLLSFLKFLFIIGFVEEIIFRGYIQTRIYGLIKKPIAAILITAVFFMLMHIPFQMGRAQMGVFEYITTNYISLLFTFAWHIVFNFMYSKYNSIAAPTLFHTFVDWTGYLFIS